VLQSVWVPEDLPTEAGALSVKGPVDRLAVSAGAPHDVAQPARVLPAQPWLVHPPPGHPPPPQMPLMVCQARRGCHGGPIGSSTLNAHSVTCCDVQISHIAAGCGTPSDRATQRGGAQGGKWVLMKVMVLWW